MRWRRLALSFCVAALTLSGVAETARPMRVLFVGNSLTYANDLPAMVARLAREDGRRIDTTAIAHPNYSLGDHLDHGTLDTVAGEPWDLVVMQQGPSSLPESRRDLIRDAARIARTFKDPTPSFALLLAWPARGYAGSWDRVDESYALAAEAVEGMLIPAGAALRNALAARPGIRLLGDDGFHPTVAGTYLAALVTYHSIAGRLPASAGTPAVAREIAGAPIPLSAPELGFLVDVAERTVAQSGHGSLRGGQ